MITTTKTNITFTYKRILYNNGWSDNIHRHIINNIEYMPHEIPDGIKNFIFRNLKKQGELKYVLFKKNAGFNESGNPWIAKYYESQEFKIEAKSISPFIIEWFN